MRRTFFWNLISMSLIGLVSTSFAQPSQENPSTDIEIPADIPETEVPEVDPDAGAPEEAGQPEEGERGQPDDLETPPLRIQPLTLHIRTDRTHQFRVVGAQGEVRWQIEESSPEGAATIDPATGMLTAVESGEVVIGLYDAEGALLTSTETIWVVGGPTRVGPERGGRVLAAEDFLVNVHFPPQATQRAVSVLLEKRGLQELPEDAQGRGTAVSIFEFNVLDEETGEDVGEHGFEEPVELTLHYTDEEIPAGVHELNLTIGTFNEHSRAWEVMPEQSVVAFDTDNNTITVAIPHASYWAVLDASSFSPSVPTAVAQSSWGKIKQLLK